MRQLAREGFEFVEGWNGWATASKPYRGLNTTWRDPRTGQFFEMQFHTKDSFAMNRTEHVLYEKWRNPTATAEEKAAARAESFKMWGTVEMPVDAELLSENLLRELVARNDHQLSLHRYLCEKRARPARGCIAGMDGCRRTAA